MSGLTMGSLFDGIGGFPLAAIRSGITPVWASEIEAFPIEVTKQRFPSMIRTSLSTPSATPSLAMRQNSGICATASPKVHAHWASLLPLM